MNMLVMLCWASQIFSVRYPKGECNARGHVVPHIYQPWGVSSLRSRTEQCAFRQEDLEQMKMSADLSGTL